MSERSYLDFLKDIQSSIHLIHDYTSDLSYDEFKRDRKTVDAVVRNFEVIGEAANNLPDELKHEYDQVEWRGVINFCHVMIHDYFRVDTTLVWDTIRNNLPELQTQIESMLRQESS